MRNLIVRSALAGLLFGLLPVVLGVHWLGLDLLRMDLGSMCEWRNLFKAGQGFGISEHIGLGVPFMVDPLQGVFYPPRWFCAFLPGLLPTDFLISIHLALAGSGAALLARAYGFRTREAFLFGCVYLFSGTLMDLARHSIYLVGGAWLPWAWSCARWTLRRPRWVFPRVMMSLALAMLLLGGDAVGWLWSALAVLSETLVYAVFRRSVPRSRRLRISLRTLLLAAAGSGVGTLVWGPALAELPWTARSIGYGLSVALAWAWDFSQAPGVFLAGVFRQGSLFGGSLFNVIIHHPNSMNWNQSPYLGLFTVLGVGLAIVLLVARVLGRSLGAGPSRMARAALLAIPLTLGISAFVFSLGGDTPVTPFLFTHFPFLSNLRYPAKSWVIVNPAALLLGYLAWRMLIAFSRRMLAAGIAVLAAGYAAFYALIALNRGGVLLQKTQELARLAAMPWQPDAPTLAGLLGKGAAPGAVGAAVLVFGISRIWRTWGHRRASCLRWVSGALLIEGLLAGAICADWSHPGIAGEIFASPLALVDAASKPVFCHAGRIQKLSLARNSVDGREDWGTLSVYQRLIAVPQVNACDQVRIAGAYSVLRQSIRDELIWESNELRSVVSAMGCTHIIGSMKLNALDQPAAAEIGERVPVPVLDEMEQSLEGEKIRAFRVKNALPEFFSVDRPVKVIETRTLFEWFRDYKPASEIVRAMLPGEMDRRRLAPVRLNRVKPIEISGVRSAPTRARIRFPALESRPGTAAEPAIVGLRTSFAEGWKATQNGQELPRLRPAGSLLGAYVEHPELGPVLFEYTPPRFALWVTLAALSALACVGLSLPVVRRRGTS